MTDAFDFTRYLASKRTVDDRALNRQVWQTLADAVVAATGRRTALCACWKWARASARWLNVVSSGGCLLTQAFANVRKLETQDAFAVDYTAIDSEESNIEVARRQLAHLISSEESGLRVRLQTANLYEFAARRGNRQRFDLIIAHALLDLLHLPTALPIPVADGASRRSVLFQHQFRRRDSLYAGSRLRGWMAGSRRSITARWTRA